TVLPVVGYNVQDPEGTTHFTYSIDTGPYSDKYTINTTTGSLAFSEDVYVNGTTTHTLTVTISDDIGNAVSASVEITIQNVNHAPVFANLPNSVNVLETTAAGSTLFTVTASDEDMEDTVTVDVQAMSTGAASYFTFNTADMSLTLLPTITLDYEHISQYNVSLQVTDGVISSIETLTINVVDVNESPSFTTDCFYIQVDEGKTYVSGRNLHVLLNTTLDYETCQNMNMSLQVHDGLNVSNVHSLQVTVTDVNEAPRFLSQEYVFTVNEQTAGGHVGGPIPVVDDDIGDTVSFDIVSGTGAAYLDINSQNGNLSFMVDYDVDLPWMTSQLSVIIKVTDNGGLTGTTTVKVGVQDVNDNVPLFDMSSYMTTTYNDALIGSILLVVNASDADSGINAILQYTISQTSSLFMVSNNGEIYLLSSLSGYTAGTVLNFTIIVSDSGVPQLSSEANIEILIAENNQGISLQSANTESESIEDYIQKPEYYGLMIASGGLFLALVTVAFCLYQKSCQKLNTKGLSQ
ncbi:hypothetical protein FSP39_025374, partial [Pinctada imbricata]